MTKDPSQMTAKKPMKAIRKDAEGGVPGDDVVEGRRARNEEKTPKMSIVNTTDPTTAVINP